MPTPAPSIFRTLTRQLRIAARFLIPRPQCAGRGRSTHATPAPQNQRLQLPRPTRGMLPLLVAAVVAGQAAEAATIYVDSRLGSDAFDGLAAEQISSRSGPVRSLSRAVRLVRSGDQIVLANNGTPYRGGFSLHGLQQSGAPGFPIEVIGNGSVLSGARVVDPAEWRMVGADIWRVEPHRKGWYQLVLEGAALPEVKVESGARELPPLAESSWCAFQGAIYFRPPADKDPPEMPLEIADGQTGVTLLAVDHVLIRDLTIQHFRNDGINLHDRCHDVVLENVVCQENGRAGIVVGGTSTAVLRSVTCRGNREASLLVEEFSVADAEGSTFDVRPVVRQ